MRRQSNGTAFSLMCAALVVMSLLASVAAPAVTHAQAPAWQTDTRATSPPAVQQPAVRPTAPANTTIVPRSRPPQVGKDGKLMAPLRLTAHISDEGQAIDQGLVWRIFEDARADAPDAKPRLLRTVRDASPSVELAPGAYIVVVSFGRAHMTKRIALAAPAGATERFIINAGGLRVNALLSGGRIAPELSVHFDLYSGESDQLGGRRRVMTGAKPGLIIRLNAGIYHVVSTYGDANAVVRSDVTVEAGKLTEATIAHAGSPVTFKLVARKGGEAQSGAQWVILNAGGATIKEAAGALPTHVLAAGEYMVSARHGDRTYRRSFTVESGEPTQVEVIME